MWASDIPIRFRPILAMFAASLGGLYVMEDRWTAALWIVTATILLAHDEYRQRRRDDQIGNAMAAIQARVCESWIAWLPDGMQATARARLIELVKGELERIQEQSPKTQSHLEEADDADDL